MPRRAGGDRGGGDTARAVNLGGERPGGLLGGGRAVGRELKGSGGGGVAEKFRDKGGEDWDMGPRRYMWGAHCIKCNI